jgi:hypothetical protein
MQKPAKTSKTSLVRLALRVPEEFHIEVKVYAAQHQLTMAETIQRAFEALKKADKAK